MNIKMLFPVMLFLIISCNSSTGSNTDNNGDGAYIKSSVCYSYPDVVKQGLNTKLILYVSPDVTPASIKIKQSESSLPATTILWDSTGKQNQYFITIPSGAASGIYDVIIETAADDYITNSILTVSDAEGLLLDSVQNPYCYNQKETEIMILAQSSASAEESFTANPYIFIRKNGDTSGDVIPLKSGYMIDSKTVSATVNSGLTSGSYDVIVINPDGKCGIIENAISIIDNPLPVILSATNSIVNTSGQQIIVRGLNFRDPSYVFITDSGSMPVTVAAAPSINGGIYTQVLIIDGSMLSDGTSGILRITNSDNSYYDYSAIAVHSPTMYPSSPVIQNSMNTARRALVSVAGRAYPYMQYIYSIGGDSGSMTVDGTYSSVESAQIDQSGSIGTWSIQKYSLNTKRSFSSGVIIGSYIYMAGGYDGSTVQGTVERARILDPAETPCLEHDDYIISSSGPGSGYWAYRVSATFSSEDKDNPGGESLPGNIILVKVPSFTDKKISVKMAWTPPRDSSGVVLPNISGYKIYRTAAANDNAGEMYLLDSVTSDTLAYTDDGSKIIQGSTHLMPGSTGTWSYISTMNTPRMGSGIAYGQDPTDSSKYYIYMLLGTDQNGTYLASYEYLPVTVQVNGHQTADSGWTTGISAITNARAYCSAVSIDSGVYSGVAGSDTYIYIGGGIIAGGTSVRDTSAGRVLSGGDLGVFSALQNSSGTRCGYAAFAANGQVIFFGGSNAAYSSSSAAAQLKTPMPGLGSWNASISLGTARIYMGAAGLMPFLYIAGGTTDTLAASTSVEMLLW